MVQSLAALLLIALAATSLSYPFTNLDTPLGVYAGAAMLRGDVLYQSMWDVRAPGVYFTYGLCVWLFGQTAVAVRVFDLLWQTATGWLVTLIARQLKVPQPAVAGLSYLALYFAQSFWNWGQPEGFLNLWAALSIWATLRASRTDQLRLWLLAAFAAGVVALCKVPYGLVGTAALVAALRMPASGRRVWLRLSILAGGVVAPPSICALYFFRAGAFDDLWYALSQGAPDYLALIHATVDWSASRNFIRVSHLPLLAAAAAIGWVVAVLRRRLANDWTLPVWIWLLVSITVAFAHGSFLAYHYIAIYPAAVILGVSAMAQMPAPLPARFVPIALVAVWSLWTAVVYRPHVAQAAAVLRHGAQSGVGETLGEYIRARTTPDDRIFVWGNAPVLYLVTGCRHLDS